ncbi:MAG: DUF6075 family protein [Ktedonobacteraceae bacterium]
MTADIFFKSVEHKQRFFSVMKELGKVYDGTCDPEYGAALYILSADLSTWQRAQGYIDCDGIDITAMLEDVHFSSGYAVLIQLAGNLFNNQQHLDPLEFLRLDENNFKVALAALSLRRAST